MTTPLLRVEDLAVNFGAFQAVRGVDLELRTGETLGIVGESGSGKSTLARAILRLVPAVRGRVWWGGADLLARSAEEMRRGRRDMQIVFQDPLASFNPRMRVGEALAEPLQIFEGGRAATHRTRVTDMLLRVGMTADVLRRFPHEFSGGQCQRLAIARAMMLRPQLLVCDEAVSSLDVSIQGQIVNLLVDLQREYGTAILFISHNLAVVRHVSHRIAVLYRGLVVEEADEAALFAAAAHPYTRALWAAVPDASIAWRPRQWQPRMPLADAARDVSGGCVYHPRCAYAQDLCLETQPTLSEIEPRHNVACHRWRELVYS